MSSPPRWVVAAALAAAATACSSSSPAPDGRDRAQEVTIHTTNEFRFQPATVQAHVGVVRVTLVDDGSYPHNLSVPQLHTTSTSVDGDPGKTTTTFTLRFDTPGTYTFFCAYHSSAGMRGEFEIS